jgi:hypothetical protein
VSGHLLFVGIHLDDQRFELVCLGGALPSGGSGHPVATFDRIRSAVRELPERSSPSASDDLTPPSRRWWRRAR